MEPVESNWIRKLARVIPEDFTIKLPVLPLDELLDGAAVDNNVAQIDVNVADLLSFIADRVTEPNGKRKPSSAWLTRFCQMTIADAEELKQANID